MPDDLVVRHPPERGRSSQRSVVVYACCTCCCCLHTVGALVGAFLGGGLKRAGNDPGFDPEHRIPGVHWLFDRLPRTQWVYWTSLFWVIVASFPIIALLVGSRNLGEFPIIAAGSFLMLGPAYLFGAWLLGVIRLGMRPDGTVRQHEFWALHKALLWAFLGMLLGLLIMALIVAVY